MPSYSPLPQQRRRRPVASASIDDDDGGNSRRSATPRRGGGFFSPFLSRGMPLVLTGIVLFALLLHPSSGAATPPKPPLRVVPLFKKPDTATGQLILAEEGLAVLRAQKEPFAIVTAVGPTRTGKSSILGRAFLRGRDENLFEVGSGITSFTTGVWITSEPIILSPAETGGTSLRVLLIDTEGFSGVGGLTSRTYEANLFGITYLMSSAIIYNSMFPVDASTVERMNAYGRRTLDMIAELNDYGVASKRLMPNLIWSVQSFNMHNLANSRMSVDDLLDDLKNASRPDPNGGTGGVDAAAATSTGKMIKSTAASAVLGGQASAATNTFVLEGLFRTVKLIPIRRPSSDDEVVANLNRYSSSKLSPAYLEDADRLRAATLSELLPTHRCRLQTNNIPLFPKRCGIAPWNGVELGGALQSWLKYGHVVDPSETAEALNETAALADFEASHDAWFQRECGRLVELLRARLRAAFNGLPSSPSGVGNETAVRVSAEAAMASILGFVKHLPRKSMARGIEMSTFWQFPSKVATYIEKATAHQTTQCTEVTMQCIRTSTVVESDSSDPAIVPLQPRSSSRFGVTLRHASGRAAACSPFRACSRPRITTRVAVRRSSL